MGEHLEVPSSACNAFENKLKVMFRFLPAGESVINDFLMLFNFVQLICTTSLRAPAHLLNTEHSASRSVS